MIKKILLWIWQFPQNLLGAIILLFNLKSISKGYFIVYTDCTGCVRSGFYNGTSSPEIHTDITDTSVMIPMYTVKHLYNSGISLGRHIIIDSDSRMSESAVRHEYGHQKQSLYLGWLYLIAIGLPSICGNIVNRTLHKKWTAKERCKWYYSQPWEKWADRLGEVPERFC